jgi:predicted transcriptional regulator
VQIGLDAANAGQLIPAEEVEAQFAAKRAATRRRLDAAAE